MQFPLSNYLNAVKGNLLMFLTNFNNGGRRKTPSSKCYSKPEFQFVLDSRILSPTCCHSVNAQYRASWEAIPVVTKIRISRTNILQDF